MCSIEKYNPAIIFMYFMIVTGFAMFSDDPVIHIIALAGAISFEMCCKGSVSLRSQLFYVIIFIVIALINPILSHNGVTVLFVVNDNPVTLEALLYGVNMATVLIAILRWFKCFTKVMTSDKLLYVFGLLSAKLSLLLSMTLRYIPLFKKHMLKLKQAQTALGLYKEDTLIDRAKASAGIFSGLVTWALENGIVTADSMTARGFGIGRRTCYAIYHFRRRDAGVLTGMLTMSALMVTIMLFGGPDITFYPEVIYRLNGVKGLYLYILYGVVVTAPALYELTDRVRWRIMRRSIAGGRQR